MAVKTLTITEGAYERLKRLKREGESFSELFLRLSDEKRSTALSIYGILKGVNTEKLLKASRNSRERAERSMEARRHVSARQFRSHRIDVRRKKK